MMLLNFRNIGHAAKTGTILYENAIKTIVFGQKSAPKAPKILAFFYLRTKLYPPLVFPNLRTRGGYNFKELQ